MAHNRPSYSGTVAKIMSLGGFKVKYMIRNGENMPEILELYGGSVLGLPWDTAEDAQDGRQPVHQEAGCQVWSESASW